MSATMSRPSRRIPEPIYRLLPLLYVACGLASCLFIRTVLGVVSGLVMVSAGALIAHMRMEYRRKRRSRPASGWSDSRMADSRWQDSRMGESRWQNSVVQQIESRVEAEMQLMKLSWNDTLATGHPAIDQQHRRLIGMGNELVTAVVSRRSKSVVSNLLFELVEEITVHFKTEEALLKKMGAPLPEGHVRRHQALLAKAEQFRDNFLHGQVSTRDMMAFLMVEVITEHAANEDLSFFRSRVGPPSLVGAALQGA